MKPTLATVVLGGCTGCHVSLLDLHERLVELLGDVDLVRSPLTDAEEIPVCDILLVEGAVENDLDEAVLRDARAKAKTLVAVGACATMGGVGGLRNVLDTAQLLRSVYGNEGAPLQARAESDPPVPALANRVRAVSDVVDVDIEVPGCAPMPDVLLAALTAALAGEPFEPSSRALCAECSREHVSMLEPASGFVSDAVYGVMELDEIDPVACLLEQGVICMGPVTREGCGARCPSANVPCRGCMGSGRKEYDQGAKMVDTLAAVLPAGAIMFLDDLVGTGYRFGLPSSVLPGTVSRGGGDDE
jgi:F420-non-reducing hydrogenase small subunit